MRRTPRACMKRTPGARVGRVRRCAALTRRALARLVTIRAVSLAVLFLFLGLGCKHGSKSAAADAGVMAFPVVRPDSEGLLLTWIDDKGDFHVETRAADVPPVGRDVVRVVDPTRDDFHQDQILVADFRQTGADGAYPVRAMARTDFEALAVARREKAGPTLAHADPTQPTPPEDPNAPSPARPGAPESKPATRGATVVIYGAEWCGACHDAARYLRRKGIPYVEKDIEKDPAAAHEMQTKLASRGLRAGSIPVIDVRGKVMVGFNPMEIDAALGDTTL